MSETLEEKIEKQKELKRKIEEGLSKARVQGDAEVLTWWKNNGYPQPAPSAVQKIKNDLGFSWTKLRKMIDKEGGKHGI
jgi:hypothetical protein